MPLIGQEVSNQYFPNHVSDSFHIKTVPENDLPSHIVPQSAWDIASLDACFILLLYHKMGFYLNIIARLHG